LIDPPTQCLDARQQLRERERLHEVIVGAELQALDAVLHRIARGEEEHGHLLPALPDGRDHRPAVAAGEHDVQHDQIIGAGLEEAEAFIAAGGGVDDVAMLGHALLEVGGRFRVVFDDQYLHRGISGIRVSARGRGCHGARLQIPGVGRYATGVKP